MRASRGLRAAAGLLTGASGAAQAPPPPPPSPAMGGAELVRRLTQALDSLAALDRFSGVVLLASRGVPVFERAYGMADREAGRPNTMETAFNVGSINKIFTSIAVHQLALAGKARPRLDVGALLARLPQPGRTIRQLLEHRSGIGGNIFDAPAGGKRSDIRRLHDSFPLFVHEPLQFEAAHLPARRLAAHGALALRG